MKKIVLFFIFLIINHLSYSQVYLEKQTRHRFAQLNIGLDFQSSFGGTSQYLDELGNLTSLSLPNTYAPRFIIGGTHFWGHADFYIAIPLYYPTIEKDNQKVTAFRGVETVFKYYPWRIEHNKIRPYIGTSLAPFYFEQENNNVKYPSGPELNFARFPLLGGLTFNSKNHLIELGMAWNYQNKKDYYVSRTQKAQINTPSIYATLSYRFMIDTSLIVEKDWESGKTKEVTDSLGNKGKLSGFYIGAGMSSAFWLGKSSYNQSTRPYISKFGTSIMPDFTLGYYFFKPDINIAIGYRGYGTSTDTYGAEQKLRRKSFVFEATKYLFDYHGFVPFIGPAISYENLSFKEEFEGKSTIDANDKKVGYGITFGWDIRPNRLLSWILRTNLRWYPNLNLEVQPNSKVSFSNIEFNFIQLIVYPDRIIKGKRNQ